MGAPRPLNDGILPLLCACLVLLTIGSDRIPVFVITDAVNAMISFRLKPISIFSGIQGCLTAENKMCKSKQPFYFGLFYRTPCNIRNLIANLSAHKSFSALSREIFGRSIADTVFIKFDKFRIIQNRKQNEIKGEQQNSGKYIIPPKSRVYAADCDYSKEQDKGLVK